MRSFIVFVVLLSSLVLISGCVGQNPADSSAPDSGANQAPSAQEPEPQTEMQQGSSSSTTQISEPALLAGTPEGSKYYRYDKEHYQQSLAEGKVVYLYFYANWCPICARDRPQILASFNELGYADVAGYEVHFNDNEVTAEDREITQQYTIPYQHSTIILGKQGQQSFKSFSEVSKEQLKAELEKARAL